MSNNRTEVTLASGNCATWTVCALHVQVPFQIGEVTLVQCAKPRPAIPAPIRNTRRRTSRH